MVEHKLSKIIRFAHDLTLFSSFLQGIIQINLSSTLATSVGFCYVRHSTSKLKTFDSQKIKRMVDMRWF